MAQPSDKLAESLAVLIALQDAGHIAIRASAMSRTHRERLIKNGFIRDVMRGWCIAGRPDEPPGESTAWYAAFWGFCAEYLTERFGTEWCLNPEQSLSLHTGDWTVPKQLLVRSSKGGNKPTTMPYGTSMFEGKAIDEVRDSQVSAKNFLGQHNRRALRPWCLEKNEGEKRLRRPLGALPIPSEEFILK